MQLAEDKLDCRGLACPGPVLKTREVVAQGTGADLRVLVDNAAARENVSRFLGRMGYQVRVLETDGYFEVVGVRDSAAAACEVTEPHAGQDQELKIAVVVGNDCMGKGDDVLGSRLMFNFLATMKKLGPDLWRLIFLNGGVKIILVDSRPGHEREETFHHEGGLKAYVEYLNDSKEAIHPPIHFRQERDDVDVEVALQYSDGIHENLVTYANAIHTMEGGTHLSGFKTALTRIVNNYAFSSGLRKEKERNLTGDEVREGLTCVISVKIKNPQFEGQTKSKLGNSEVEGLVNLSLIHISEPTRPY